MNEEIFEIKNFNVINDDENYYVFRGLSNGDHDDIESGITTENIEEIYKRSLCKTYIFLINLVINIIVKNTETQIHKFYLNNLNIIGTIK